MIWLGLGMTATFLIGYEVAKEYAAYAPLISAAKNLSSALNPTGPSSTPTPGGPVQ